MPLRSRTIAVGVALVVACVVAVEESLPDKSDVDISSTSPSSSAPPQPPEPRTATNGPCERKQKVVRQPLDIDGESVLVDVVIYEECKPAPTKDLGDPPPPFR